MLNGIHHITAIAGDPQENYDFYTGVMGLRLVKRSINQDAPDTYHLFYADGDGNPGTDLTFFPWPAMGPAKDGAGKATEVTFAVRTGSLPYWKERLTSFDIDVTEETRFNALHLVFRDVHGLGLAITETDAPESRPFTVWEKSPVPAEHQLLWMHSTRMLLRDRRNTDTLLTAILGFNYLGEDSGWHRYGSGDGGSGTLIDIQENPSLGFGRWGTGGIHHIAWRVATSEEEMKVREKVQRVGLSPSPQIDRFWFKSVYFQEPGGVLFEIATDGPGFGRDEDMEHLGETLILPPWYEPQRKAIENGLPELKTR